jgi:hypothetical protein
MNKSTDKTEHQIQVLVVDYLMLKLPPPFLIYAIPNGGKRDGRTGAVLKAEGVLAGIPDLHVPIPRNGYASLYLELKRKGKKATKTQKEIHNKLELLGNQVLVVDDWRQAVGKIIAYYEGGQK